MSHTRREHHAGSAHSEFSAGVRGESVRGECAARALPGRSDSSRNATNWCAFTLRELPLKLHERRGNQARFLSCDLEASSDISVGLITSLVSVEKGRPGHAVTNSKG